MELCGLTIRGYSRGGRKTGITVPELDISFEMGGEPTEEALQTKTVCITSGLMEHTGCLHLHAYRRFAMGIRDLPTYIMPTLSLAPWVNMFEQTKKVHTGGAGLSTAYFHARSIGEHGTFYRREKGYVIRGFKTNGTKESIGYLLNQTKIVENKIVETPLLAYTGYGTIGCLMDKPMVLRAKVLILDCTYLDSRMPRSAARRDGRGHLADIIDYQKQFVNNEYIVLSHISPIYELTEIQGILEKQTKDLLSKIRWLN